MLDNLQFIFTYSFTYTNILILGVDRCKILSCTVGNILKMHKLSNTAMLACIKSKTPLSTEQHDIPLIPKDICV